MLLALTRAVPRSIDRCELTHLARTPIDYARAVAEHDQYEAALRAMGCCVERLPAAPDFPDSVFVEDTAVVFDDLAVIARPGAPSRRGELEASVAGLSRHRRLAFIQPPGTLDGGDVLVMPGTAFVGDTPRTNADGARQLAEFVAPLGYEVVRVPVAKCLHLKSAVSSLPPERERSVIPLGDRSVTSGASRKHSVSPALLINPDWVDVAPFAAFDVIDIDPGEPAAANVLTIGDRVFCASEYPRTRARLDARGFVTLSVPAGELAKAEGGLTCGSLILRIFNTRPS
jgi:dimethylargininase